jgi:hypothetical protein
MAWRLLRGVLKWRWRAISCRGVQGRHGKYDAIGRFFEVNGRRAGCCDCTDGRGFKVLVPVDFAEVSVPMPIDRYSKRATTTGGLVADRFRLKPFAIAVRRSAENELRLSGYHEARVFIAPDCIHLCRANYSSYERIGAVFWLFKRDGSNFIPRGESCFSSMCSVPIMRTASSSNVSNARYSLLCRIHRSRRNPSIISPSPDSSNASPLRILVG